MEKKVPCEHCGELMPVASGQCDKCGKFRRGSGAKSPVVEELPFARQQENAAMVASAMQRLKR